MVNKVPTLSDLAIKKIITEKVDYSCLPSLLKRDIETKIRKYASYLERFNHVDRQFEKLLEQVEDPYIKKYYLDIYTTVKSEIYTQYLIDERRFMEFILLALRWVEDLQSTIENVKAIHLYVSGKNIKSNVML